MKFSDVVVTNHNFFSGGHEKKNYFNQFFRRHKKLKNGHFWPPLHKSKLNFHVLAIDLNFLYEFTILNSSKLAITM